MFSQLNNEVRILENSRTQKRVLTDKRTNRTEDALKVRGRERCKVEVQVQVTEYQKNRTPRWVDYLWRHENKEREDGFQGRSREDGGVNIPS